MESLSPECTPLKHAYDSCFNSWFEGYLQPALNHASRNATASSSASSSAYSTPAADSSSDSLANGAVAEAGPSTQPRRLVTSWAYAIGRKAGESGRVGGEPTVEDAQSADVGAGAARDAEEIASSVQDGHYGGYHSSAQAKLPPIDTRGKTRAQIKAEEYERNCGALWKSYQTCLQKAISENESLSTLLNAAREEHPLRDRTGLKGTVWDTENAPANAERD